MHPKLIIVQVVSIIYLILTGYVLANVRRLKVGTFYKIIIALTAVLFAPGGLIWYLILRRRDKRRKKKNRDEEEAKK
jgi:hypothetical protein